MNSKTILYSVGLLLWATSSYAQEIARGYVFEDVNQNGIKERGEKGIPYVSVTNGIDVVQTNQEGFYELAVVDDQIIAVIKPSAHDVPVDEQQLPRFYYIHKPDGSPQLEYAGVAPTGKLPTQVNFPLTKTGATDAFKMVLFGDPQVKSTEEVGYFRDAIVRELKGLSGYAFGMSLGDLVANRPHLFNPYIEATREIGIPWYNVLGNHDINFDVQADSLSDESFEAHFGPANYAFNYGKVHFIVLDDIIYPDPRDNNGYWGGLNEDQLTFIQQDLVFVPKDYLIVLAFHIPITNVPNGFRKEDRGRLFELLKDFPYTLSLSAHTHRQVQHFLGREDGWLQDKPHHHFNAGTTSGNWYSGALNEQGIPVAMMGDGTPKGYSLLTFEGNKYTIDYKVAGKPKEHQIRIYAPKVISHAIKTSSGIYANFFMGSEKDTVQVKIGNGEWKKMDWVEEIDPTYLAELVRWDESDVLIKGRRPGNANPSTHLWRVAIPKGLPVGTHSIQVKATDMFGRTFTEKSQFRVE